MKNYQGTTGLLMRDILNKESGVKYDMWWNDQGWKSKIKLEDFGPNN